MKKTVSCFIYLVVSASTMLSQNAKLPEPKGISGGCRASYDAAVPTLLTYGSLAMSGVNVRNFPSGQGSIASRLLPDPSGSGVPLAVVGMSDGFSVPVCVYGDDDLDIFIPLDTMSIGPPMAPDRWWKDGGDFATYFFLYRI